MPHKCLQVNLIKRLSLFIKPWPVSFLGLSLPFVSLPFALWLSLLNCV